MFAMLTKYGKATFLLILLIGLLVGMGPGGGKKKKRTTYEYCSLIILRIGDKSRNVYMPPDQKKVAGRDMVELCERLGIGDDGSIYLFMNYLGSKGWRLVEIDHETNPDGTLQSYYFERAKH